MQVFKFLRYKISELKELTASVLRFGPFHPLVKFWFFNWLILGLLWPILRISLGREKSFQICNNFLKKSVNSKILSLPNLPKGKILIKETGDYPPLIEIYLQNSYDKDIIKNGMNVIDIGAHIGSYTILAAEKIGNTGKVIAIEPEPKNYSRLIENIKINNFQNVLPLKIALSDHKGPEKLYIGYLSGHHSLKQRPLFHSKKNTPFTKVEVKTLDALLSEINFKKIDIIKIDTEGTEMPILRGAEKTLKNNPEAKIIVASYHYPDEKREVQEFLQNLGFKTKISPFSIVKTL